MQAIKEEVLYDSLYKRENGKKWRDYVYSGSDESLSYTYITNPLAWKLVKGGIPPPWVGCNLITMVGFSITLITHYLVIFKSTPETIGYYGLLQGLGMFMYQFIDVLDGKQQLITDGSESLSVFYDHGCDCLNCALTAISLSHVIGLAPWEASIALFLSVSGFFFKTLEHYATHHMALGLINGVEEGILSVNFCTILTFIYG